MPRKESGRSLPTAHIALLRGVNVGGGKRVPMAALREIAVSLGFLHVRTLLNSGNLVYHTVMAPAQAEHALHTAILDTLQVNTRVFVRTPEQMQRILDANPMTREAEENPSKLLVTVWSADTTKSHLSVLVEAPTVRERFVVGRHAAYLWFPDGISASVVYEKAARPLGDRVTARNWSTMQKLLAMATDPSVTS